MLGAPSRLRHVLFHEFTQFAGHHPSILVRIGGSLETGQQDLHEHSAPVFPGQRFSLAGGRQDLDRSLLGVLFRRQASFKGQLLRRGDFPSGDAGIQ